MKRGRFARYWQRVVDPARRGQSIDARALKQEPAASFRVQPLEELDGFLGLAPLDQRLCFGKGIAEIRPACTCHC